MTDSAAAVFSTVIRAWFSAISIRFWLAPISAKTSDTRPMAVSMVSNAVCAAPLVVTSTDTASTPSVVAVRSKLVMLMMSFATVDEAPDHEVQRDRPTVEQRRAAELRGQGRCGRLPR